MNDTLNTSPPPPLLLTIPEACEALRVSRWQIYRMINDGRLKTVRIDRRRFVTPDDLQDLIKELREGGTDVR
ncbi:helix-turn-helix domain-containing protein [Actinomadura formosensis]|uniref:helix-turn-helix domain-containing protein n=1 Tax=Actinomadura formosensis TaxID=60706 RepID=UPI000AC0CE5B|nr:helix-turn-helix domain-containing protein [Actinomadura formosensis]